MSTRQRYLDKIAAVVQGPGAIGPHLEAIFSAIDEEIAARIAEIKPKAVPMNLYMQIDCVNIDPDEMERAVHEKIDTLFVVAPGVGVHPAAGDIIGTPIPASLQRIKGGLAVAWRPIWSAPQMPSKLMDAVGAPEMLTDWTLDPVCRVLARSAADHRPTRIAVMALELRKKS